jgi:hypothetical protein
MKRGTFWFGLSTGAAIGVVVGAVCARRQIGNARGWPREGVRRMRAVVARQIRRFERRRRWEAEAGCRELDWGSGQADVQSAWVS